MNKLDNLAAFLKRIGNNEEFRVLDGIIKKEASKKDYKIIEPILREFKMFGFEDPYHGDEFYSEGGYSEDTINKLKNVSVDIEKYRLQRVLSRYEKSFLLLGAILTRNTGRFGLIFDYLDGSGVSNDFFARYNLSNNDIANKEKVISTFTAIDIEQDRWHKESAEKSAEDMKNLKTDEVLGHYKTNDVVYNFDNGYRVVRVPASEDTEFRWKDDEETSYDRVIEGNLMGICLGSGQLLYQSDCEVYSLRDRNNNPHVTMRIEEGEFEEIKGKSNEIPVLKYSRMVREWIGTFPGNPAGALDDYFLMPVSTVEEAEHVLKDAEWDADTYSSNPFLFETDLISEWYDKSDLFKEYVEELKEKGDSHILNTALADNNRDEFSEAARLAFERAISDMQKNPLSVRNIFEDINDHNITPLWMRYQDEDWCVKVTDHYVEHHLYNNKNPIGLNSTSPFFHNEFFKHPRYSRYITQEQVDIFVDCALWNDDDDSIRFDRVNLEAALFLKDKHLSMLSEAMTTINGSTLMHLVDKLDDTLSKLNPTEKILYPILEEYILGASKVKTNLFGTFVTIKEKIERGEYISDFDHKIIELYNGSRKENIKKNEYGIQTF